MSNILNLLRRAGPCGRLTRKGNARPCPEDSRPARGTQAGRGHGGRKGTRGSGRGPAGRNGGLADWEGLAGWGGDARSAPSLESRIGNSRIRRRERPGTTRGPARGLAARNGGLAVQNRGLADRNAGPASQDRCAADPGATGSTAKANERNPKREPQAEPAKHRGGCAKHKPAPPPRTRHTNAIQPSACRDARSASEGRPVKSMREARANRGVKPMREARADQAQRRCAKRKPGPTRAADARTAKSGWARAAMRRTRASQPRAVDARSAKSGSTRQAMPGARVGRGVRPMRGARARAAREADARSASRECASEASEHQTLVDAKRAQRRVERSSHRGVWGSPPETSEREGARQGHRTGGPTGPPGAAVRTPPGGPSPRSPPVAPLWTERGEAASGIPLSC
jgi:hypothetical protein